MYFHFYLGVALRVDKNIKLHFAFMSFVFMQTSGTFKTATFLFLLFVCKTA